MVPRTTRHPIAGTVHVYPTSPEGLAAVIEITSCVGRDIGMDRGCSRIIGARIAGAMLVTAGGRGAVRRRGVSGKLYDAERVTAGLRADHGQCHLETSECLDSMRLLRR